MRFGILPIALLSLAAAAPARASILGGQGVEIRGPYDRRGFFMKPTIGAGAYFSHSLQAPTLRVDIELGAGATQDLTIGVQGGPGWIFGGNGGVAAHADVIVRGFLDRGFFLQAGAGVAPTPRVHVNDGFAAVAGAETDFGGQLGAGYESWVSVDKAFGIAVTWDARFNTDGTLVNGVVAQAYVVFY